MKYYFLGSLIPLTILCLHSLKNYSNIFFPFYMLIYTIHLTGRPYKLGVIQWYKAQRIAEFVLLMNFRSYYPCMFMFLVLMLVHKNIHLTSLYALMLAIAGKNPILSVLLICTIALHDLPFNPKEFRLYFHIRMIKNFILFFLLWAESTLYWSSLIFIVCILVIYYATHQETHICMEYFSDSVPIIYPIPLDVKDAVEHCDTAKVLFKIHVL